MCGTTYPLPLIGSRSCQGVEPWQHSTSPPGTSSPPTTSRASHPRVLEAIAAANAGHAIAYGDDPWTERAAARSARCCGAPDAEVLFTFNGTGANVVGLASLLRPHESVLCTRFAHIAVDECGAPSRFTGSTLVVLPTDDGRLDPALDRGAAARRSATSTTRSRGS